MSDKIEGFRGLSIEQVQEKYFRRLLPANGGRFRYLSSGLNARAGTVVLFQFQAHVIASARFLRDERFERSKCGCAGELHFEPASFVTFDPVDRKTMLKVWPGFKGFGHVKHVLNPMRYSAFKRRLKGVRGAEPTKK